MNISIGIRLRSLRESKKMRQSQVADIIRVDRRAISAYEIGDRQPSYDILISLARLYHVSTDYLLGVTDIRTIDVSGLTEPEVEILNQLVLTMTEKNRLINKK